MTQGQRSDSNEGVQIRCVISCSSSEKNQVSIRSRKIAFSFGNLVSTFSFDIIFNSSVLKP